MSRNLLRQMVNSFTFLMLGLLAASSHASSSYPTRPIRLIIPYAAGATSDQLGRALGQLLSEQLGQPVVIENKPGASTTVGVHALTAAPADGYTLLLTSASTATYNPLLLKKIQYKVKDLQHVALVADVPLMLLVNPEVPANTVEEFVRYAKGNPGKLAFATVGAGTSTHLAVELLKQLSSIELGPQISFGGNAQALLSLMRNDTQLMFDGPSAPRQQIETGKVKLLGVGSSSRLALYKDTPTIGESYPGFKGGLWYGVAVQNGVPADVVSKLRSAIHQVLSSPEFQQRTSTWGVQLFAPMDDASLQSYLDADYQLWRGIITKARISID